MNARYNRLRIEKEEEIKTIFDNIKKDFDPYRIEKHQIINGEGYTYDGVSVIFYGLSVDSNSSNLWQDDTYYYKFNLFLDGNEIVDDIWFDKHQILVRDIFNFLENEYKNK